MKDLYLICNAHLDIVWLWREEEGIAEAVSTFRIAADFCEQYDGFVFCHNEAILYEWVESLAPELFARIQRLVAQGKWRIMGGWYLQPDCNVPSGEAMYRQIQRGRRYFAEKFGKAPTTAVNVDSFGHSRGLVQILRRCGYDSYLFGRPMENWMELPSENFWWTGYDGSRICAHRSYELYHSLHGEAEKKIRGYLAKQKEGDVGVVLWGIGNHGGGPSREDWKDIQALDEKLEDISFRHAAPEDFFGALAKEDLPVYDKPLRPIFVGSYTSQCRIKQQYRALENDLFLTEKLLSYAALTDVMEYPTEACRQAETDLLVSQFHDTIPGTTIAPVEEDSLRRLGHGREILRRLRDCAFFRLAAKQARAEDGAIPLFVYNPHPYAVSGTFCCEIQLADQNWDASRLTEIEVWQDGVRLPSQLEKEDANLNLDWRKRVVFFAELAPSSMNRFTCVPVQIPKPQKAPVGFRFRGKRLSAEFDEKTGFLCSMSVDGKQIVTGSVTLGVFSTDEDPWNSNSLGYPNCLGQFRKRAPLRVIEDGAVCTVIEGDYSFGDSRAVITYRLPKLGGEAELKLRLDWREENCVLKWLLPSAGDPNADYLGEDMFAVQPLQADGNEMVSQRWCAIPDGLAVINEGIYGSSCRDGVLALTLLQSSVYSALTLDERDIVIRDRELPVIDIGRRNFTIWLSAADGSEFRKADIHNQKPFALCFFSGADGADAPKPLLRVDSDHVQLSAFYQDGESYVVRLYESAGIETDCTLDFPALRFRQNVHLSAYAIVTARLRRTDTGFALDTGSEDVQ